MTNFRVANPHPLDLEHDRVVLSNREAQVVKRARNKSYAEIGEELEIAESTVGTYYSRANTKLGEQVTVMEAMLDQQRDAHCEENIEAVARYAVERLRDRGLDVELEIQSQNEQNENESEAKATVGTPQPPNPSATASVDKLEGELGDDHEYTERIRKYANEVIHDDQWPLDNVDLSKVTFETRTRAKKRLGVASYEGSGAVTIGISEYVIQKSGFEAAKQTIRHELVHAWQYQHMGKTVELPNGTTAKNVDTGHKGCWYEWEDLMNVQRTGSCYDRPPEEYNYEIWCTSCHKFITGKFRMCSTVKCHSEAHNGLGWCSDCDEEGTDGSTFVVTDDDNEFYDNKEEHEDW